MSVRPATVADAEPVARVRIASWQAAYADILPSEFLDGLSPTTGAEGWATLIERPDMDVFVWEEGSAILGFAGSGPGRPDDGVGELYAIYVHPDRWGEGIGKQLLEAAVAGMGDRGYPEAMLWVLEQNAPARWFYEDQGWITVGTTKTEQIGGVDVTEIQYLRRL